MFEDFLLDRHHRAVARDMGPAIASVANIQTQLRYHDLRPALVTLEGEIVLQLRRAHVVAYHFTDNFSPFRDLHQRFPVSANIIALSSYIRFPCRMPIPVLKTRSMGQGAYRKLAELSSQRGRDKFAPQEFRHQRPDQIRQIRLVAVRFRGSKAVVAKMKIVPLERLAIGMKTLHHPLLHRKRAGAIIAAIKHHGWTVAVGTALASGPPHGSVREGLPHTALTSGSCDGQPLVGIRMLSLLAACRTHHKPCDSHPRLCVRHECACGAFPLVDLLPSADSAANA